MFEMMCLCNFLKSHNPNDKIKSTEDKPMESIHDFRITG